MMSRTPRDSFPDLKDYSGKKILLVDENMFLCEMISKVLAKYLNIEVFKVNNGAQAIANALTGRYDGAIIDLSLPGGSCLSIIQTIKTMLPRFPIAIMHSHPSDEMLARARRSGITLFLGKPFSIITLIREITKLLETEDLPSTPSNSITVEE